MYMSLFIAREILCKKQFTNCLKYSRCHIWDFLLCVCIPSFSLMLSVTKEIPQHYVTSLLNETVIYIRSYLWHQFECFGCEKKVNNATAVSQLYPPVASMSTFFAYQCHDKISSLHVHRCSIPPIIWLTLSFSVWHSRLAHFITCNV